MLIALPTVSCDYELTPATETGITLVFVHGWLLSRSYWQPLVQVLAPQYQCLAYDLRGFGRSQAGQPWHGNGYNPPIDDYSLQAHARDLQALMDQLAIRQAWLVGHSLGGSIALWAADQMPDRVQGVVCINAGGGIYLEQEFAKFRTVGQQMLNFRPPWLRYAPLLDRAFGGMAVKQPIAAQWGKQRLIDFLDADREAARLSLLDSTTQAEVHRLPQIVARLHQPVHFIAGQDDKVMEPRYVRHLASFHYAFDEWGENVLELEQCGHLAMLEHTDAVAQYIQSIVQGNGQVPACG